ncbi:hypothetical protein, partial [Lacrimispora amygdalina]|uniref:hypothetical protein n=1 Tax=Lacrimispora amygdalina TaxID=253257 RepID=UPI001A9A6D88
PPDLVSDQSVPVPATSDDSVNSLRVRKGATANLQQTNGWMDKLFHLLVVDVNSVWNGLQVISGFSFRRKERQKKKQKRELQKKCFHPL